MLLNVLHVITFVSFTTSYCVITLTIFRSEVIKLMEEIKKKEEKRPKFKYNTGFDYYPFQK